MKIKPRKYRVLQTNKSFLVQLERKFLGYTYWVDLGHKHYSLDNAKDFIKEDVFNGLPDMVVYTEQFPAKTEE